MSQRERPGRATGAATEDTIKASVTVDVAEYVHLRQDAEKWRTLEASPHVAEIIADFIEWEARRDFRETTNAISEAGSADWQRLSAPDKLRGISCLTYAKLAQRRTTYDTPALTPEQIREQAASSWAEVERRAAA